MTESTSIKRYNNAAIPDNCLAEIVKIIEIREIPDADTIELYKVKGWWCVSKKNIFKVDDLVVYIK